MESPFGLYPRFYVKRKSQLFPLIEKYSGEKIKEDTKHGKVIQLYFNLLRTEPAFKADVDTLISGQISNLSNNKERVMMKKAEEEGKKQGISIENSGRHGIGVDNNGMRGYNSATGFFSGIVNSIGSVVTGVQANKLADKESDQMFMEAVINEQKNDDTMKILVVTGITLAFVGLGVYLVLKLKK